MSTTNKTNKGAANAAAAAKVAKPKRVTVASKMDSIIQQGGTWAELCAKCQKISDSMGYTLKFSPGTIRAHIRFRTVTQKNVHAEYLQGLTRTTVGLFTAEQLKAAIESKQYTAEQLKKVS